MWIMLLHLQFNQSPDDDDYDLRELNECYMFEIASDDL